MNDNMSVEISVEDLENKHAYVRCHTCNKDGQKVDILASVVKYSQLDEERHSIQFWDHFQILKCCGCETVFFRSNHHNSEEVDYDYGPNGETRLYRVVIEKLYPEMANTRNTIKDFHLLPHQLQAIYTEAAKALHSNQPVLAGIGVRAILETICKDQNSPGNNLSEKIDGLKDQGVLSPNGAVVLHKLRVLGNKSAHEVTPHSDDQLSLAFDVLDNLLVNVYILEPQAKALFK